MLWILGAIAIVIMVGLSGDTAQESSQGSSGTGNDNGISNTPPQSSTPEAPPNSAAPPKPAPPATSTPPSKPTAPTNPPNSGAEVEIAGSEKTTNDSVNVDSNGYKQQLWPYFFRDKEYGTELTNKTGAGGGFKYTKAHPGYDVTINNNPDSSPKPGMETEQVLICSVAKCKILGFNMSFGSSQEYFEKLKAEEKSLVSDGWQQGNWCAMQTVDEIEYIKYEAGDKFTKGSPSQGKSKLIIRVMHMQQDLDTKLKVYVDGDDGGILEPGQAIGYVGNTGRSNAAHIHIDINYSESDFSSILSKPDITVDPTQFFECLQEKK